MYVHVDLISVLNAKWPFAEVTRMDSKTYKALYLCSHAMFYYSFIHYNKIFAQM